MQRHYERLADAERYYEIAKNAGSAGGLVGLENVRQMREEKASTQLQRPAANP